VVKQQVKIPVHVMIRPRAGDFHYSDQEMDVMRTDVRILKENGADGFVLGLLHRFSRHFQFVLQQRARGNCPRSLNFCLWENFLLQKFSSKNHHNYVPSSYR